ncbi:MAG TPA: transposase, partial [Candidatus Nitrosocosmicus sp.]
MQKKRINKLNISIDSNKHKVSKDEYIVIAIDSTGIKFTNRGQWMRDKWHTSKNNKKGYLKIHIAVNIKTNEILPMKVTDEHVHDSKALPELIDNVIE